MGLTLYEIDERLLNCFDEETGEILEDLDFLEMAREEKIDNIGCWIKSLNAENKAIKDEIRALQERARVNQNKADSLKGMLETSLNGEKYKSARVVISYRKSESVVVDDVYKLPEELIRYKEPEPLKTEIKKLLKEGVTIDGCFLEKKQNMQIR